MLITGTEVVCPAPRKGMRPTTLDLSKPATAMARIREVAIVTPHKAPELLATFNEAYLSLHEAIVRLEAEKLIADREANKIRSVVMLERAPKMLAEKGLTTKSAPGGSEDFRRAVLDADEEYQDALDIVQQLTCVVELLKGQQKAIEMAYTSVKKILGERTFGSASGVGTQNPSLRGDTGDAPVGSTTQPRVGGMVVPGFGGARIDPR